MRNADPVLIRQLCATLQVDEEFVLHCLEESVIEVHEIDGHLHLANATALRLRQIERICAALDVSVPAALMIHRLTERVAELEEHVRRLKDRG